MVLLIMLRQAYPVGSSPRGLALIIDNERFENNVLPFREGSMIDANNLDILFEQLGFKVSVVYLCETLVQLVASLRTRYV